MMKIENEQVISAIEKAVDNNMTFFAYSLPTNEQMHFGAQIIEQQISEGFLIQPFVESLNTPKCFISAQLNAKQFLKMPVTQLPKSNRRPINEQSTIHADYLIQAQAAIDAMKAGEYCKIVLSRVICNELNLSAKNWTQIFCNLKAKNPNSFVFIFNCEETGFWIGASPEKYLAYDGEQITTMALAGTRLVGSNEQWGQKEIDEQAIVVDFITEKFTEAKLDFEVSPIYSRQAAGVEHLCNDFRASVSKASQVNALRSMLHPTPALGGMPAKEAVKFICKIENHDRRYYGGYIGPIDSNGNFDLYVNLRSMQFDNNKYCIYVGGGLTSHSVAQNEWEETSHKAQTLLSIIENTNNLEK